MARKYHNRGNIVIEVIVIRVGRLYSHNCMQLMCVCVCVFREFADPLALARGKSYEETIQRGGKILVEIQNFSPYGDSDTGKSSLCDALKDRPHADRRYSTEGVERSSVLCQITDDRFEWREIEEPRELTHFVKKSLIKEPQGASRESTPTVPSGTFSQPTAEGTPSSTQRTASCTPPPIDTLPVSYEVAEYSVLIADIVSCVMSREYVSNLKGVTGQFRIIRVVDLAGQDVYRTLQDGVIPKMSTVYSVVYDASDTITSVRPEAKMRRGESAKTVGSINRGQTHLQYVLDCVDTLKHSVDQKKCSIYIVGTKIDLRCPTLRDLQGEELRLEIAAVEKALDEDRCLLRKKLRNLGHDGVVKGIFYVDNTRRSGLCSTSLAELRRLVSEDHVTTEEVPVPWLLFTLAVVDLARKSGECWLPRCVVLHLAKSLGSINDDNELGELLRYQQALGFVLCSCSDGDEGPIIVDVDVFLKCVSALIIPEGLQDWVQHLNVEKDKEPSREEVNLYSKGILTEGVAETLWQDCKEPAVRELTKASDNRETLYRLMESLQLLHDIGDQKTQSGQTERFMLVPCIAKQKESSFPRANTSGAISLIRQNERFFPLSKLAKLAWECLCELKSLTCNMLKFLHMSMTEFRIPWREVKGILIVITFRYIRCGVNVNVEEVYCQGPRQVDPDEAARAVDFLTRAMLKVLKPTSVNPAVVCPCVCEKHQCVGCQESSCVHFVILKEGEHTMCTKSHTWLPLDVLHARLQWLNLYQVSNIFCSNCNAVLYYMYFLL